MMMASSVVVGPLGNYLVPLMIGSRRTAFPRVEAASFWIFFAGYFVILTALPWAGSRPAGPVTRLCRRRRAGGMDSYLVGFAIIGLGMIMAGFNLGRDDHPLPGPGNDLGPRADLRDWSILATAALLTLGDPDARRCRAVRRARPHRPDRVLRQRARRQHVSCGRTSSGSSATPRSTSWRCRGSGS